ncbi:hypothetical protein OC844_003415 [Tilletia horrida]|nr:hypothetical protein OC844_003415 [Tilletia horrida]
MGVVFSTLGTALSWIGSTLEMLCLAVGEIASVLVRGIFTILVGLCDVAAALSCCYRRPWSRRPARGAYDGEYDTMLNVGGQQVLKNLAKQPVLDKKEKKPVATTATAEEDADTSSDEESVVTPANEKTEQAAPAEEKAAAKTDAPEPAKKNAASKGRRFSFDFLKRNKAQPAAAPAETQAEEQPAAAAAAEEDPAAPAPALAPAAATTA